MGDTVVTEKGAAEEAEVAPDHLKSLGHLRERCLDPLHQKGLSFNKSTDLIHFFFFFSSPILVGNDLDLVRAVFVSVVKLTD